MSFQSGLVRPLFIFYVCLSVTWPDPLSEGDNQAQPLAVCINEYVHNPAASADGCRQIRPDVIPSSKS